MAAKATGSVRGQRASWKTRWHGGLTIRSPRGSGAWSDGDDGSARRARVGGLAGLAGQPRCGHRDRSDLGRLDVVDQPEGCGPATFGQDPGQTGIAAALTNTTKTIGGSFASAVFGVVLIAGVASTATATAASLAGYMVVWAVCGIGALVAAVLLFFVPKLAFADVIDEEAPDARAPAPAPDSLD